MTPEEVLDFWFGPGTDPFGNTRIWWRKDAAFDSDVSDRFGGALAAASRGELDGWCDEPRTCLAFIVLLDQLSRNVHRGSAAAFAGDERALAACLEGIRRGLDARLGPAERAFFYMPLMHAEDLATQNASIVAFATLFEEVPEEVRPKVQPNLVFSVKHQKVIKRFGRFPHRNAILGRASTPEEIAFLSQPGSAF